MPSTERWLLIHTSTPALISAWAMSACMSEKPIARSGCSARMRSSLALVKAETRGFSWRARAGRTVKPEMPTMRCSSPSAYSTSVGSSVRQTMRCGKAGMRRDASGEPTVAPREPIARGRVHEAAQNIPDRKV